jgi:hypothetical protein
LTQIKIGLGAIFCHEDLAMLIGRHRAGVDVDVGIEFLHRNGNAASLQNSADRGRSHPLAYRANDATGEENKFGHFSLRL